MVPEGYLDYLVTRSENESPYMRHDGGSHYRGYYKGVACAHIDRPGHFELQARIKDLDAAGLDTQLLSVTIPGSGDLGAEKGVYWAKKCNDALEKAMDDYPGRFYFLATLPWQVPDQACKELERCHEMGCVGVQMFSNFDGEPVFLEKFHGIYEMADKHDLPMLVHPANPLTAPVMDKMRIPYQLWGYTLDTSMAVVSMIFQGLFQKFKKLTLVHGHLGGMVPYFVRRFEDSYKGYGKEWGIELSESPDKTYRKRVYPDTTSFYLPAMKCCLEWMGADHMCIGTDYAHRVGDPEGAIKAVKTWVEQAGLSQQEIDMILGKNLERIFKLPSLK